MLNEDKILEYTILFIEDEEATRKNYVNYLSRYFKNVYHAKDGEEGLKQYKEKKPDILIVDINLPKMNGLDLLKEIRKNDLITKALMLTAHSDSDFLLKATELKLSKYLLKPISRSDLKDALNIVLEEFSKYTITANKFLILKDGYTWNKERCDLLKDKKRVDLTLKETKLLDILFSNTNINLSYDDIIINVWDNFDEDKINALKTLIKNVRKKLPENTIENIYGKGYKVNS